MQSWWTLSLDALFQGVTSLIAVVGAFLVAGYEVRRAFEASKKTARWERDIGLRDALIPLLDLAHLAETETRAISLALRHDLEPASGDPRPAHPNVFAPFEKYDEMLMAHWKDVHRSEKAELEKRFLNLRANLGYLRHGLAGLTLAQQVAKLEQVCGLAHEFEEEFHRAFPLE